MNDRVTIAVADGIADVRLNRADKMNAIDPAMFESGRHLAASAGLAPKQRSTGGKQRMGGISRAGNERLRALLVSGATSVINHAMRPGSIARQSG